MFKTMNKGLIYPVVILLAIPAILAFITGISASFEHTIHWSRWLPWYGKVG